MKEYLLPTKVVGCENGENTEGLFVAKTRQAPYRYDAKWRDGLAVQRGGYLLLDFGKEMHGGIRIITGLVGNRSCRLRIRFVSVFR